MRYVRSGFDVDRVLSAPSAVLCMTFDWWDGHREFMEVLGEWAGSLTKTVGRPEFYLVEPFDPPYYYAILENVAWIQLPSGGCGSAVWIRSGKAVEFEPDVAQAGVSRLQEKTRTAFRA